MIGQWIRITDALLTDELGWHAIAKVEELYAGVSLGANLDTIEQNKLDEQRLTFGCDVVVTTDPRKHERGMPGAGARICHGCITWLDKHNAERSA